MPRQNPTQSIYFVIGSKFHFSSQQTPPKNKYTNSPKKWTWKLPWRKSVPRCLLVDKTESNNSVLIIISRCLMIISCEISYYLIIIFISKYELKKKHYLLMNFHQLCHQLSCLYIICNLFLNKCCRKFIWHSKVSKYSTNYVPHHYW